MLALSQGQMKIIGKLRDTAADTRSKEMRVQHLQ